MGIGRRVLAVAAVGLGFAACSAPSWRSTVLVDEFTDATACRVESGSSFERTLIRQATYTPFAYYFFAEKRNGVPRVGLRSEPLIPIAGDVQIRVDSNTAWTISVDETPIDLASKQNLPPADTQVEGADAATLKAMNDALAAVNDNIQKFGSPYRVTTGDKATAILNQVANGREVKFRVISTNAAASFTGSFEVDESFRSAVRKCGLL